MPKTLTEIRSILHFCHYSVLEAPCTNLCMGKVPGPRPQLGQIRARPVGREDGRKLAGWPAPIGAQSGEGQLEGGAKGNWPVATSLIGVGGLIGDEASCEEGLWVVGWLA